MKFEANMSVVGKGNMIGKGTVIINDCITIDNVRLMKYKDGSGVEKGFVALPQKKVIINGEEKWEPVIDITAPEARAQLLEVVQNAVKEDLMRGLDEKVEVKKIVIQNNKQLRGFAHIQVGGIMDIRDIRIYENKNNKLFTVMPKVQSGNEWKDVIHFNNEFTYNNINHSILKAYEEIIMAQIQKRPNIGEDMGKEPPKRRSLSETEIADLVKEIVDFTTCKSLIRSPDDLEIKEQQIIKALKENPKELYHEYKDQGILLSNMLQSSEGNWSKEDIQDIQGTLNTVHKIQSQLEKLAGASPTKLEKTR
ncbi:MAG: septation protein SpoVG family protein [Ruminococcus sp.]|nr:septation protein SpoVG family protein [Ruminococcus sp.]